VLSSVDDTKGGGTRQGMLPTHQGFSVRLVHVFAQRHQRVLIDGVHLRRRGVQHLVVTDHHKVYFCRSELNPADYIIWVRASDKESSYMFLTHADLKLVRTLYLKNEAFPGRRGCLMMVHRRAAWSLASCSS